MTYKVTALTEQVLVYRGDEGRNVIFSDEDDFEDCLEATQDPGSDYAFIALLDMPEGA
jgi:hypothetical protein